MEVFVKSALPIHQVLMGNGDLIKQTHRTNRKYKKVTLNSLFSITENKSSWFL